MPISAGSALRYIFSTFEIVFGALLMAVFVIVACSPLRTGDRTSFIRKYHKNIRIYSKKKKPATWSKYLCTKKKLLHNILVFLSLARSIVSPPRLFTEMLARWLFFLFNLHFKYPIYFSIIYFYRYWPEERVSFIFESEGFVAIAPRSFDENKTRQKKTFFHTYWRRDDA